MTKKFFVIFCVMLTILIGFSFAEDPAPSPILFFAFCFPETACDDATVTSSVSDVGLVSSSLPDVLGADSQGQTESSGDPSSVVENSAANLVDLPVDNGVGHDFGAGQPYQMGLAEFNGTITGMGMVMKAGGGLLAAIGASELGLVRLAGVIVALTAPHTGGGGVMATTARYQPYGAYADTVEKADRTFMRKFAQSPVGPDYNPYMAKLDPRVMEAYGYINTIKQARITYGTINARFMSRWMAISGAPSSGTAIDNADEAAANLRALVEEIEQLPDLPAESGPAPFQENGPGTVPPEPEDPTIQ